MKLKHVNPHNVRHQVPTWAIDPYLLVVEMDSLLDRYIGSGRRIHWDSSLTFWIDAKFDGEGWRIRVAEPELTDAQNFCGRFVLDHPDWSINIPLNELIKGAPSLDGSHSVYVHTFPGDAPLSYVGLTKRRWFERLSQHECSARGGSQFLFHRALRDKQGSKTAHRVLLTALDHDTAMELEQQFVEEFSLYPKGLNMIPGGFAGIKYLHSLGVLARTSVERDEAVERLASQNSIEGRANPLCAARWLSDQDYINRVVCGHSGRLTVDQVRSIRMMSAGGVPAESIAASIRDTVARVKRVTSGKRYGRAA